MRFPASAHNVRSDRLPARIVPSDDKFTFDIPAIVKRLICIVTLMLIAIAHFQSRLGIGPTEIKSSPHAARVRNSFITKFRFTSTFD